METLLQTAAPLTVRIIIGASHAYACIFGADDRGSFSLDQRLHGAMSAGQSLKASAAEYREQADRLARLAARCDAAAEALTLAERA